MLVDMKVPFRLQGNIDERMARQLLDHVIEEADAGGNVVGAGAVEIHGRADPGLLGPALDGRGSGVF